MGPAHVVPPRTQSNRLVVAIGLAIAIAWLSTLVTWVANREVTRATNRVSRTLAGLARDGDVWEISRKSSRETNRKASRNGRWECKSDGSGRPREIESVRESLRLD